MAQWRSLLGIPDYMTAADFTELMSNWARFIALLLAEVNHSLMRSRKLQEANREKCSLPPKKDDNNGEQGGKPDGATTSMMQTSKSIPVFTQMRRLRQSIELLPPRRRSTRTFLLLQRLYASGHFRHGVRVLEPYLRALEQLLQSFAPSTEVAVEDVDVAWCEAVMGKHPGGFECTHAPSR